MDEVEAIKVALTATQVRQLNLPPTMEAKVTSSRYDEFVELHGNDVFELEAIPPAQLQAILRESIDSVLDTPSFNSEVEAEKRDAAKLDGIRKTLQGSLGSVLGDAGGPSMP